MFVHLGWNVQMVSVPVLREREIMHPPIAEYCAWLE